MTNKDVYPVTAAFERKFENYMPTRQLHKMFEVMAENIGEYEHGTADVEEVVGNWPDDNGELVGLYAAVCDDLLVTLAAYHADNLFKPDADLQKELHISDNPPDSRIEKLRAGKEALRLEDVITLYKEFYEAKYSVGEHVTVTLVDFGNWLAATGDFKGQKPAEVAW